MSLLVVFATLFVILGSLRFILIPRSAACRKNNLKNSMKLPPGPGPLPIIGNLHMLTSLPHRGLQSLAQKYGPIMSLRLGNVPAIVVSSPRAAELFLKKNDAVFESRPRAQAAEYLAYGTRGLVFAEYGPYWRNLRKLCLTQLLSGSKIETFSTFRREEVELAVESIKEAAAAREVVDVSRKVGKLIADVSSRIIFGSRLDNDDRLQEIIHEGLNLAGAFNLADYVPYLKPLDLQGLGRRMKKVSKAIDEAFEKIIVDHERKQQGNGHKDFVDFLLSMMNQPMNPQDDHVYIIDRTIIKAIILDMISAAFETSTASIEWTFSELLRNPRVMKNLQDELESVVGMDRMVEEKDLAKLEYLDMVVKESFRLHPVGPLLLPHESMEEITIEGYHVPKKSRIIINTWAIGRDPNVWSENVEEFYPERFIGSNSIADLKGHDFRLLPFGSGRRGCPGMQFGLVIVRFVLAQLVHCFSWEIPSGTEAEDIDMTEKFGISVGRANHLLAKPIYRLYPKTM